MPPRRKTSTATSNFGVSTRESHDATAFYERFRPPDISRDDTVLPPKPVVEPFMHGDARDMQAVADGSVALVVTSPPYFAGKTYEEELERDGVPSSYLEYLDMLRDVFRECVRTLEPGGRIAVNVANLGRRPYRSLSADVIRILEHDLGLLLRAELIWQKGEGASGSCAWGSFRSPSNPVIRDITERVIVASKGRFDRARSAKQRAAEGLPSEGGITADDFMALTLDVWEVPTESARRVGHPAPFPVELPDKLIRLYTYTDDLVLDPFMGSGSTLVAAAGLGRRYIGYDLDAEFVGIARRRVAEALAEGSSTSGPVAGSGSPNAAEHVPLPPSTGQSAQKLALEVLEAVGFRVVGTNQRVRATGVTVSFVIEDASGQTWFVDVAGTGTTYRGGLLRSDAVWKALGRAHALRGRAGDTPLLLLTTHRPKPSSEGDVALHAAGSAAVFDVIEMGDPLDVARLAAYATGESVRARPMVGFWTERDLPA